MTGIIEKFKSFIKELESFPEEVYSASQHLFELLSALNKAIVDKKDDFDILLVDIDAVMKQSLSWDDLPLHARVIEEIKNFCQAKLEERSLLAKQICSIIFSCKSIFNVDAIDVNAMSPLAVSILKKIFEEPKIVDYLHGTPMNTLFLKIKSTGIFSSRDLAFAVIPLLKTTHSLQEELMATKELLTPRFPPMELRKEEVEAMRVVMARRRYSITASKSAPSTATKRTEVEPRAAESLPSSPVGRGLSLAAEPTTATTEFHSAESSGRHRPHVVPPLLLSKLYQVPSTQLGDKETTATANSELDPEELSQKLAALQLRGIKKEKSSKK